MAKTVAAQKIKVNGKVFEPGATVTGLDAKLMAELLKAKAIEEQPNAEPSIKDTVEAWREFLVTGELLTQEDADKMDKDALLKFYAEGETEEEEE